MMEGVGGGAKGETSFNHDDSYNSKSPFKVPLFSVHRSNSVRASRSYNRIHAVPK